MNLIKEIKKTLGCSTADLCLTLGYSDRRLTDQHITEERGTAWSSWLRAYVQLSETSRRDVFRIMYGGLDETPVIRLRAALVNEELLAIALFRKLTDKRKSSGHTRMEFAELFGIPYGSIKNYELNCPTQAHTRKVFRYLRCWSEETMFQLLESVIKENTR